MKFYIFCKYAKDLHNQNILLISIKLDVSNFEMPGIIDKVAHPFNINFMFSTLLVFHLEISGKNINDEHKEKIPFINLTFIAFIVFHLEISDKEFK